MSFWHRRQNWANWAPQLEQNNVVLASQAKLGQLGRMDTASRDVARPEGKSSNSLVDTLVCWTEFLEAA
jgi:hypothetical protein